MAECDNCGETRQRHKFVHFSGGGEPTYVLCRRCASTWDEDSALCVCKTTALSWYPALRHDLDEMRRAFTENPVYHGFAERQLFLVADLENAYEEKQAAFSRQEDARRRQLQRELCAVPGPLRGLAAFEQGGKTYRLKNRSEVLDRVFASSAAESYIRTGRFKGTDRSLEGLLDRIRRRNVHWHWSDWEVVGEPTAGAASGAGAGTPKAGVAAGASGSAAGESDRKRKLDEGMRRARENQQARFGVEIIDLT